MSDKVHTKPPPAQQASWPACAGTLSGRIGRERLDPVAVAEMDRSSAAGHGWLVALSGGADSLALLLLAWALWPEQRSRLAAAHFNHAVRGAAADADEAFCRSVCAALGVPCATDRRSVVLSKRCHDSETALRAERIRSLHQAARARHASVILTGHQADDVAETFLLRLLRGSGPAGLAAPRPVHVWGDGIRHVRPLLSVPAPEIRAALAGVGAAWCEDATNRSGVHVRNRLRRLVPRWLAADPGRPGLEGLLSSRAQLEEAADALEAWTAKVLAGARRDGGLHLAGFDELPLLIRRGVLRRWLEEARPALGPSERMLAAWDAAIGEGQEGAERRILLPDGSSLCAGGGVLRLQERPPPGPEWPAGLLPAPGMLVLPDGTWIEATVRKLDAAMRRDICAGRLSGPWVAWLADDGGALSVRFRRPGDRFQPLGMPAAKKVQDILVDARVPKAERSRFPLVADSTGAIVWIPGLAPAEQRRITETTKRAVRLEAAGMGGGGKAAG